MRKPDTPAEAAQRQLDAYNAGDVEAFVAVYAEGCTVRHFPSGNVLMAGRETIRARYGELFRTHPKLHGRLLSRMAHEVFAVDHEHVEGLREGEVVYAVAMYEVRDGLIQNAWFLKDDATTAE